MSEIDTEEFEILDPTGDTVDVPLDPPECFQGELSQIELVRLALRSELLHDRRDTIRRLNRQLRTDALG